VGLKFLKEAKIHLAQAHDIGKQEIRVLDGEDRGLCTQRLVVQLLQRGQLH
jgi:hypothetical protein